ncbi:L-seryl-tRNA(Sec) selenium transferase [bacterium SCGC AG-212-C10]|nr:L-seryl-tRNA(Sec) selenium transferase [bacterium SCGC AG-212-C10]
MRSLPSVDQVLALLPLDLRNGDHAMAVEVVRAVLAAVRTELRAGGVGLSHGDIAARAEASLRRESLPSLRTVINASGVILQTNLGRAPLSERAIAAVQEAARDYTNLEFDLDAGARGSRHEHVRDLIRRTTSAEDGIVVNNNAAALLMVLQAFAQGREVVVSRGQAVEIGGGFRIPDVLRQSGARLVEVGTTNRTYVSDYTSVVTAETAAFLRVHASNFRVVGFTAEAPPAELAAAAHAAGVLLFDDLGSGCLVDTRRFGMAPEPTVQASLSAGSDLVLFSGDKLIGGPQCGIIAGSTALVGQLRRHPLARALRVDKLTVAALNATLRSYAEGREADEIPVWQMASRGLPGLKRRAQRWAAEAETAGSVIAGKTMVGGGSLPGEGVATWLAAVNAGSGATMLAAALRAGSPAVVPRIEHDRVILDPRTVDPRHDATVTAALRRALTDSKYGE